MSLDRLSNELLYAPFTSEYEVSPDINATLTNEEFFGKCFVPSDFDKKISEIDLLSENEIEEDEYPLNKDDLLREINREKKAERRFLNWMDYSGEGAFCVLGDAGTGKTTYLHSLQWNQENIQWKIIDIRLANVDIDAVGSQINFLEKSFSSLHGKVISSLLNEIMDSLFIIQEGLYYNYATSKNNIQSLLNIYSEKVANLSLAKDYRALYDSLNTVDTSTSDREYCEECAEIIADYFNARCVNFSQDENEQRTALNCALAHYLIYLFCMDGNGKRIVAFDNIERFVGVDEIYSSEINKFVKHLRGFCDTYGGRFKDKRKNINLFARKFQFVISMRNTTVRNFTSQQNADFYAHTIDLSTWFAVNEMISRKLQWYNEHKIEVAAEIDTYQLMHILNDIGLTPAEVIRGLRPKLNYIFNYNKRLMISFLVNLLNEPVNQNHLKFALEYKKMEAECSSEEKNHYCALHIVQLFGACYLISYVRVAFFLQSMKRTLQNRKEELRQVIHGGSLQFCLIIILITKRTKMMKRNTICRIWHFRI